MKIYINSEKECDVDFRDGYLVKNGGNFALGKDFGGELSHVNVFSKVHGGGHHGELGVMCGRETGDLLAWPAFKFHIVGVVQVIEGKSCEDKQGWPEKFVLHLRALSHRRQNVFSYASWNSWKVLEV